MAACAKPMLCAAMSERSISKFFMRFMKPAPSAPTRMSSVRTTSSKYISQNGMMVWPILCSGAVETPGVSFGKSHIDMLGLPRSGSSSFATASTYG